MAQSMLRQNSQLAESLVRQLSVMQKSIAGSAASIGDGDANNNVEHVSSSVYKR